jgi:hypothetical protein
MSDFARWSGSKSKSKAKGAAISHHKISIAKKVIKLVHRTSAHHKILRRKWIVAVHRDKLRTFGVKRAGTHTHKARPKQPRRHRSYASYRKPRKPKY